jgi:hypothetical protein
LRNTKKPRFNFDISLDLTFKIGKDPITYCRDITLLIS